MKSTILTFMVSVLVSCGAPVYALDSPDTEGSLEGIRTPNILPLECDIERPVPLDTIMGESLYYENGLEIFRFDTNGDGIGDVELAIPQNDENRYPLFYMFDRDYDGEPDYLYTDQKRDGTCDMIAVKRIKSKIKKEI